MRRGPTFLLAALAAACDHAGPVAAPSDAPDAASDAPAVDVGPDATVAQREEDSAEVVSAELPTSLACGAGFDARVVMRNTGRATWTRAAGYKLGTVDDSDPLFTGDTRVLLPEGVSVPPGAEHAFTFRLEAPSMRGAYGTDWRMVREGVRWFGGIARREVDVRCETVPTGRRAGRVRLSGRVLRDDTGELNALGASLFWAAWAWRNDRPRLERNLAYLASHGFDYFRALGVVGDPARADYWDGREIEWRWPDYADVIAGVTDLAWDRYGLRVEWTLIGDGQVSVPAEADRYRLVDTFLAMSRGREHKVMHFEIANESWQNGFSGSGGLTQLRALAAYMNARTDILVAASAPPGDGCGELASVYDGGVADIATVHFDRDISQVDGPWRPVRRPWGVNECADLPVASNNEPIGPGSSVNTENDPARLVAGAVATWVSGVPMYVFHSRAGVRGDVDVSEMPGADAFVRLRSLVPADIVGWTRRNSGASEAPFQIFAHDARGEVVADAAWPDLPGATGGVVRAYGAVRGGEFFVFPMGVRGRAVMAPRRAVEFDVIDPLTGMVVRHASLGAGERFELTGGAAFALRGRYR